MMTEDDYQHFVCIAAGDDPKTLMAEYDKNISVPPYVVYKKKDAHILKEEFIKAYKEMRDAGIGDDDINDIIEDLTQMDDNEFFARLISDQDYIVDGETGDAISTVNKNGKWSHYSIGKLYSIPFLTKDGREVFSAKKGDIAWDAIHLGGGNIYARAWEMVMEDSKPANDYEEQILKNMGDKKAYFQKFETKDNYVVSNTAFWGYAFLSEKTGWQEMSEVDNQFDWMSNFYDVFIKNLPDDTLLTIYECRK